MQYLVRKFDGRSWVDIAEFGELEQAREHAREHGCRLYMRVAGELVLLNSLNRFDR